ncbi:hypothetical protein BU17DRAFT_68336 [Hysterangium stoloniferum]|nr:hypothetical protein BU17DRAFT_68336 [Hysterangium stoloniferum]
MSELEHSERSYEFAKNLKDHSERSGRCRFAKDLKKYSEKSGGPAKNLEEHSDRKDGVAKNLKGHSKRNVELAKILEVFRKKPQACPNFEEAFREDTNLAKHLAEHSGRNELGKNLEQHLKRNAQLGNDLEKHLRRNDKVTKIFDGSSGHRRKKIELDGDSSQEKLPVSSTLRRVLKRSDEILRKFESSLDKPKWQRDRKWNVQDPAS